MLLAVFVVVSLALAVCCPVRDFVETLLPSCRLSTETQYNLLATDLRYVLRSVVVCQFMLAVAV